MQPVPNGYGLSLSADGTWSIGRGVPGGKSWLELATGSTGASGAGWHELSLSFDEDVIRGEVDGTTVGQVTDATWLTGMVGLSGDYSATQFADLAVEPNDPIVTTSNADVLAVSDLIRWSCSRSNARHATITRRFGYPPASANICSKSDHTSARRPDARLTASS